MARSAADDANGRIALVIGNNAYVQAPLSNPVSDARSMGELLKRAGFLVDVSLDATREVLNAAIARFIAGVARSDTREAIFYFAGHGAQLDWRNYLLPVDAMVNSPLDLKTRCLDLNHVLGQLPRDGKRVCLLMLDACRNNPFGQDYRPDQQGLSQFDAPPGTLLAYATGPGRVASDGAGEHGLYTQYLLEELRKPGIPIEESLKRVRLNVRLASQGEQIPWETTSLESSVFVFPPLQKSEDDYGQQVRIDEELAHWNRIKSARNAEAWIDYLRRYPNGKFAEIAQVKLDKFLPAPKASADGGVSAAESQASQPSANPYSVGRYALGRRFTVGDTAAYVVSNLANSRTPSTKKRWTVTRVDVPAEQVELNNGGAIWDLMGNPLQPNRRQNFDIPAQFYPSDLYVGKKWVSLVHSTDGDGEAYELALDFSIPARENISVPAGDFSCFRIEGNGLTRTKDKRLSQTFWIVPGVNFFIRREVLKTKLGRHSRIAQWDRWDLTELEQAAGNLRPPRK